MRQECSLGVADMCGQMEGVQEKHWERSELTLVATAEDAVKVTRHDISIQSSITIIHNYIFPPDHPLISHLARPRARRARLPPRDPVC